MSEHNTTILIISFDFVCLLLILKLISSEWLEAYKQRTNAIRYEKQPVSQQPAQPTTHTTYQQSIVKQTPDAAKSDITKNLEQDLVKSALNMINSVPSFGSVAVDESRNSKS